MRAHVNKKKTYINGCTIGSLAWFYERIPSIGSPTSLSRFPRLFRWDNSKTGREESKFQKALDELTSENVVPFIPKFQEKKLIAPPPTCSEDCIDNEFPTVDMGAEALIKARDDEIVVLMKKIEQLEAILQSRDHELLAFKKKTVELETQNDQSLKEREYDDVNQRDDDFLTSTYEFATPVPEFGDIPKNKERWYEEEKEDDENEEQKEEEESVGKPERRSKRGYDFAIVLNGLNINDGKEKGKVEGFVTPPAPSTSPRKKSKGISSKRGLGGSEARGDGYETTIQETSDVGELEIYREGKDYESPDEIVDRDREIPASFMSKDDLGSEVDELKIYRGRKDYKGRDEIDEIKTYWTVLCSRMIWGHCYGPLAYMRSMEGAFVSFYSVNNSQEIP